MKCGRPTYSLSSVRDEALLCCLRILRFSEIGLMWSSLPAIINRGARRELAQSTPAAALESTASKNALLVPGM